MKTKALFLMLCLSLSACATVDRIKDPVQNSWIVEALRNASCISVDVPPITLTPERTAAERQLMGEEKELMPNGWLLSSSTYVPPAPATAAALPPAVRTDFRMLSLYDDIVLRYRYLEFIGEGSDGLIFFVPAQMVGRDLSPRERVRLQEIVNDVNQSRRRIFNYYAKENPSRAEDFRLSFLTGAGRSEWVRDSGGRTIRKSSL